MYLDFGAVAVRYPEYVFESGTPDSPLFDKTAASFAVY